MFIIELTIVLILLCWLFMTRQTRRGLALIHELPFYNKLEEEPLVSVIMLAREEATTVEQTVEHLLAQDYTNMELIVINERLQEQTGKKLEAMKAWSAPKAKLNRRIKVIHITQVPEGWLGTNHALYQGYLQAKGKYLLFTDADLVYHQKTLSSAIYYMQKEGVDQLTLLPAIKARNRWLHSLVQWFLFSLFLCRLPWRTKLDNQRKPALSFAAFTLFTREAYEQTGTHRRFALRADALWRMTREGKRIGLSVGLLTALNHLEMDLPLDLASVRHNLEKMVPLGPNHRFVFSLYTIFNLFLTVAFLLPLAGLIIFWGSWPSFLCGLSLALAINLYLAVIRTITKDSGLELALLPITLFLFLYSLLRLERKKIEVTR